RGDPLARADAKRVAALGADAPGALHLGAVDDLLAGLALDPESLGDDRLLRPPVPRLLPPPKPGHLASEGGSAPLPNLLPKITRRGALPPFRASPRKPGCAGKAGARNGGSGRMGIIPRRSRGGLNGPRKSPPKHRI